MSKQQLDIFNTNKDKLREETPTILATSTTASITLPTLSNGKIWVGNSSNIATEQSVSGDATLSNAGVLTLANSGVSIGTYNTVTVDIKGRVTSGSNTSYLTGNQTITLSGDASGSGATGISVTLANTSVTPGTYTKISVDSKGRAQSGTQATTADINSSTNRRYVTDAELVVIGNTSNTNSGDEDQSSIKTKLTAAATGNDGYLTGTDWDTFNNKENALTFSTGLTRTTNTITNNLSTGVVGGQSVIGGTASGDKLTLSSTSHGTKGKIDIGSTSTFDEVNTRLGIGTTSPTQSIHTTGAMLTGAPSGGTAAAFKVGTAASVSPTSPNRTIEIEISGTTYYLSAKTSND